ncbi:MAG TPA: PD-(D/E)XK nuclease family protein, partial [Thermoanaerobaculia bacterium]|nr:PD-(D/E)XK nuclease family protein [Thermoanaerobaculia bacterium]
TRSVFDGYIANANFSLEGVSPTQLEDFGECPQKFLLKHVLDVDDLDTPERELQINHRDKGSTDHRILEQFYRGVTDADYEAARNSLPVVPPSIIARLEAAIDAEFDRLESEAPPFNRNIRAIERNATKRILRDFVARDLAELVAHNLRPRHFEYKFAEPFIIHAAGVPIRIKGKIDRIDQDDARFRIVDYKSGKALRHQDLSKKIDRGVRLQLAMYAMAVSEFFSVDPGQVSGTIKPIVAGEAKATSFAFDLADKHDGLQQTLDIFASAILRGHFPAFPNEKDNDFNSCKYCAVKLSCRTKHDPEEKYAVTRSREPRTLLQELR